MDSPIKSFSISGALTLGTVLLAISTRLLLTREFTPLLMTREITPSLVKAIEESRIFIPVFSLNYASSSFCLDELVHIIHCYKAKGRLVLPIFYGVDPTHVRHQNESFGKNLAKHEKRFQNNKENMERLQQWKVALNQAANLSRYHFSQGYEYKFIEEIVKCITNNINRVSLHVGLEPQVEQVKSLLEKGSDDWVQMVELCGIGGLDKSKLAKAIYNFIGDQFQVSCFLHNMRENLTKNNLSTILACAAFSFAFASVFMVLYLYFSCSRKCVCGSSGD